MGRLILSVLGWLLAALGFLLMAGTGLCSVAMIGFSAFSPRSSSFSELIEILIPLLFVSVMGITLWLGGRALMRRQRAASPPPPPSPPPPAADGDGPAVGG